MTLPQTLVTESEDGHGLSWLLGRRSGDGEEQRAGFVDNAGSCDVCVAFNGHCRVIDRLEHERPLEHAAS